MREQAGERRHRDASETAWAAGVAGGVGAGAVPRWRRARRLGGLAGAAWLALAALSSCARGSAQEGICTSDAECAPGFHCVRATGACVTFTTPLDVDGGSDAAGSSDGSAG